MKELTAHPSFRGIENKHSMMRYAGFQDAIAGARDMMVKLKEEATAAGRKFRVIDVGGGHGGDHYGKGIVNAVVDLLPNKDLLGHIDFFRADLCNGEDWASIEQSILKEGKYDFCICRHTLEDLDNPKVTVRWLERIAKRGWISVPSYFTEMSISGNDEHHIGKEWTEEKHKPGTALQGHRGYTHHKWIFFGAIDNPDLPVVAYPKMAWLNAIPEEFWTTCMEFPSDMFGGFFDNCVFPQDLSFFWEDKIPVIFVNPNLALEKLWANEDRNEERISLLQKITNVDWALKRGVAGLTLEQIGIQDWTFLTFIHENMKIPSAFLEEYRKMHMSIHQQLTDCNVLQAGVTLKNMPWYTIWLNGYLSEKGQWVHQPWYAHPGIKKIRNWQKVLNKCLIIEENI
jgi:hypothetical protein